MLVLWKILRVFVNTLTDGEKYSLLYRDNLTEPIKTLLSQKQKTFSQFFCAFLKSKLNFAHYERKDDSHSRCISQISVSEKGDSINVFKIPSRMSLPQKTWQNGPKTVEICTTLPLPYLFIPANIIQFEKVYVSAMKNLKTVCKHID